MFHINDRAEFDHVTGTDLKDSGREEMKDDDFICPSLESESESSESSESSSSKSEESKDGPAEAYNDPPPKKVKPAKVKQTILKTQVNKPDQEMEFTEEKSPKKETDTSDRAKFEI